jgi:hypothetical protein
MPERISTDDDFTSAPDTNWPEFAAEAERRLFRSGTGIECLRGKTPRRATNIASSGV